MRVYLAAPWVHKTTAAMVAEVIEAANHEIVVQWWKHPDNSDPKESERQAITDLDGIESADAFVLLGIGPSEGKSTEFGYALKAGKPCIVFIPPEGYPNVFRWHPKVFQRVSSMQGILKALVDVEIREERRRAHSDELRAGSETDAPGAPAEGAD